MDTPNNNDSLGVLLVDHGSRIEAANQSLAILARGLRSSGRYWSVRHAHMELATPTIAEAFEQLVADGVGRVIVLPYFLALGRHAARDIPHLCDRAAQDHPHIPWRLAEPVGTSPGMPAIINERIGTALAAD